MHLALSWSPAWDLVCSGSAASSPHAAGGMWPRMRLPHDCGRRGSEECPKVRCFLQRCLWWDGFWPPALLWGRCAGPRPGWAGWAAGTWVQRSGWPPTSVLTPRLVCHFLCLSSRELLQGDPVAPVIKMQRESGRWNCPLFPGTIQLFVYLTRREVMRIYIFPMLWTFLLSMKGHAAGGFANVKSWILKVSTHSSFPEQFFIEASGICKEFSVAFHLQCVTLGLDGLAVVCVKKWAVCVCAPNSWLSNPSALTYPWFYWESVLPLLLWAGSSCNS